jgi:hypothetical protein
LTANENADLKYTAVSDAKKNKLGNSWIAGYSQTVYNKKVAD